MIIFIFLDTMEKLKSELRDKRDIIAPKSRENYALVPRLHDSLPRFEDTPL